MDKEKLFNNTTSFEDDLIESLKDHSKATAYLEVALEDYEEDDNLDNFLLALKDIAKAQGGFSKLAKKAGTNREHLYRILSKNGKPSFHKLLTIISAMGFKIKIEAPEYDIIKPHEIPNQNPYSDLHS